MYNNKLYGYVINSTVKGKKDQKSDEPDFTRIGLCGIINYLHAENKNKKYYGLN